jgi:hypothetical protein
MENKYYVIMLLLVNIIVSLIFFRAFFDRMIPSSSIYAFGFISSGNLFIDYNMIFIIILYSCILVYNILNMERKKKN